MTKPTLLAPEDYEAINNHSWDEALQYLDDKVDELIRDGKLSEKCPTENLEIALEYAYIGINSLSWDKLLMAEAALNDARAAGTNEVRWLYRMGVVHLLKGELEQAEHYFEEGRKVDPTYPWCMVELAKLLAGRGERAKALSLITEARELVGRDCYEINVLVHDINRNASLRSMLMHFTDEAADQDLIEYPKKHIDKRLSVNNAYLLKSGLERNREALSLGELSFDGRAVNGEALPDGFHHRVPMRFHMSIAGFSNLPVKWLTSAVKVLLDYLEYEDIDTSAVKTLALTLEGHVIVETSHAGFERFVLYVPSDYLHNNYQLLKRRLSQVPRNWQALWYRCEDDPAAIIKCLERFSLDELPPALISELARAYNNVAQHKDSRLEYAITLLERIRDWGERTADYAWYYRMGYALYYLDREDEACLYFRKCFDFPGSEFLDGLPYFRERCERFMTYPNFGDRTWAKICARFWDEVDENMDRWEGLMLEDRVKGIETCSREVAHLLPQNTGVAVTILAGQHHPLLINFVTSMPNYALFISALIESMPEDIRARVEVSPEVIRLRSAEQYPLSLEGETIPLDRVFVSYDFSGKKTPSGSDIDFYFADFAVADQEMASRIFPRLELMFDSLLGQGLRAHYLSDIGIVRTLPRRANAKFMPLLTFIEKFKHRHPEYETYSVLDYIDSKVSFDWRGDGKRFEYTLPLADVMYGEASFALIISNYLEGDDTLLYWLRNHGATAVALMLEPAEDLKTDAQKKLFMTELQDYLSTVAPTAGRAFAWLTGAKYLYLCYFVWDLDAFLDAVIAYTKLADHMKRYKSLLYTTLYANGGARVQIYSADNLAEDQEQGAQAADARKDAQAEEASEIEEIKSIEDTQRDALYDAIDLDAESLPEWALRKGGVA